METPNLPPSQQTDRLQQTKEDVPSARPRLDKMWQLPGRVLNELCVKSAAKSASILLIPGSGRPVPLCTLPVCVLPRGVVCGRTAAVLGTAPQDGDAQVAAVRWVLLQERGPNLSGTPGCRPGLRLRCASAWLPAGGPPPALRWGLARPR